MPGTAGRGPGRRAGGWRACGSALIVAGALLAPGAAAAEDARVEGLRGLAGVEVLVELVRAQGLSAGAGHAVLQREIEARLAEHGLTVLSREDALASAGAAFLHVRIVMRRLGQQHLFTGSVELFQDVVLVRDGRTVTAASTWRSPGSLGLAEEANAMTVVRNDVRDQIDAFAAAWRAANRPRASGRPGVPGQADSGRRPGG